jgi:hypothetical protein
MPIYFFHLRTGPRVHLDSDGRECADLAEAKRHAIATAAERIRHSGDGGEAWRVEIADAGGQYLAAVGPTGVLAD